MKIERHVLVCLLVVALIGGSAFPLHAQRRGAQIGVTQQVITPMVNPIAPMVNPIAPFVSTFPFPNQPAFPQQQIFNSNFGFGFPPTQAAFPNQFPNQFPQVFPGQTIAPGFVVVPQSIGPAVVMSNVPQPQSHFGPPVHVQPHVQPGPPVGMPRSRVIEQFGQPTVTIITSTSETLYFNGGVTVIIQNDKVAPGPN